jgi:Lantibiotic dehydratase, N terminus
MLETRTAPDLLQLPGSPFRLWSQGVVRAAGFPISDLVSLGDPEYASAVDASLDSGAGPGAGETSSADFSAAAEQAMVRQAASLAAIASRPAFQEAVTWQNHAVVQPMIVGLAREPVPARPNQRYRKKQRIVAKYWARYCAKNDTIGFSGPSCWFQFDGTGPDVAAQPGPGLVKSREVFFEGWPIDTIAAMLAADPEIRPWVAPRLNPMMCLTGEVLLGVGPPVAVSSSQAAALRLADGRRPGCEVVAALVSGHGVASDQEGFRLLEELAGRGWLYWDLETPLGQRPERYLYDRLADIGDVRVRDLALTSLRALDAGRDQVASAVGPERLQWALEELDATFLKLTSVAPSRREGRTYGSRRLVYLDCERDLDLTIGRTVLESFAPPISVLLYGARWLSHRLAMHFQAVVGAAYDRVAAQTGSESVSFLQLMPECGDELFARGRRGADRLLAEFAALWRRLLRMETDAPRVDVTTDQVWAEAGAMFAAAVPGWSYAAQHGVDLHLAARSLEALHAGEYEPVIGEIHVAWNALQYGMFVNTHPDLTGLIRLTNAGSPPRVMLTPTKDHQQCTTRTAVALDNGRDWWLSVSSTPAGVADRQFSMAELKVRRVDGRLEVCNGDGRARFDIADIVGMWLANDIRDAFKAVAAGRPHTPRVRLDGLVVYRETWTVPVRDVPFRGGASEHATFVGARRWMRELGLPRFVFAKLSTEMKPFYADFASPVQVANLATELRAAHQHDSTAQLSISEMYPAPEQAWLPDANGRRYTSELRLQFVDSVPPSTTY